MDFSICAQCGVEIENKGIHFRNHVFCSDECCEAFDTEFADKVEPIIEDLLDDDLVPDEIDEDVLVFRDDDIDETLDDEFDFKLGEY